MRLVLTIAAVILVSGLCRADSGVGPNGIDATGLKLPNGNPLNGSGVGFGQVEGARPGKPIANGGPDDGTNSAPTIVPAAIYMGASTAAPGNGNTVRILGEVQ